MGCDSQFDSLYEKTEPYYCDKQLKSTGKVCGEYVAMPFDGGLDEHWSDVKHKKAKRGKR